MLWKRIESVGDRSLFTRDKHQVEGLIPGLTNCHKVCCF